MEITPLVDRDRLVIKKYDNHSVLVNNTKLLDNFIMSPDSVIATYQNKIEIDHVKDTINKLKTLPEILIFGTGFTLHHADIFLIKQMRSLGINFDVMDSGSACRTYNVLVTEGRDVLLALNLG